MCGTTRLPENLSGIALVAVDLDGTALDPNHEMSPRTVQAIHDAQGAGVEVVMITGRPVQECVEIARRYDLTGWMCASNGAVVFDLLSGEVVRRTGFSAVDAIAVITGLRATSRLIQLGVVNDDVLALDKDFPDHLARSWKHHPNGGVESSVHTAAPIHKILAWHPDGIDAARAVVGATGVASEVAYSTTDFLELTAVGVHKGSALRWIAETRDIDLGRCAAIGDMPNDLTMLGIAGLPLAMGNAHPEVLAAGSFVLPSNRCDGAAHALEAITRGVRRSPR